MCCASCCGCCCCILTTICCGSPNLCGQNLDLAFSTAERCLGLARLLDAAEMAATGAAMGNYDERSVMTYVIELRKRLARHVPDDGHGGGQEAGADMDDSALNALVAQNLAAEEITFDM